MQNRQPANKTEGKHAALPSGSQLSRGSAIVMVPLRARMIFFNFLQPMRQPQERVPLALLKQPQAWLMFWSYCTPNSRQWLWGHQSP